MSDDNYISEPYEISKARIEFVDSSWEGFSKMPIEDTLCPECGLKMISRKGKYGTFWGCSNYPECKGTRDSMGRSKAERDAEKDSEDREIDSNNDKYRFRKQ